MLAVKEFRDRAKGLPDLLNYAAAIDDGIIMGKNGALMACWYFRGEDMMSSTHQELSQLSARLNNVLTQFGSGWMLNVDAIRRYAAAYPSRGAFPDRTTLVIDEERRQLYMSEGAHLESLYALTVTYLPPSKAISKVAALMYEGEGMEIGSTADRILDGFKKSIMEFEAVLSGILKVQRMKGQRGTDDFGRDFILDDQLRYLEYCISGENRPVRLPPVPMYLDSMLGNHQLTTGMEPKIDNRHVAVIAIDGYPQESWPGMLGALDLLDTEYRWSSRFIFLDGHDAKALMNKLRKKWQQKQRGLKDQIFNTSGGAVDLDAVNMTVDTEAAMAEVETGAVKYGFHTSVIVLLDEDRLRLKEKAAKIRKVILEMGFGARIEDVNAVEAFLGSIPGHGLYNVRRPMIHTMNLSDMLPITAVWAGPEHNPCPFYPEKSPPLAYAATSGATPFRLSLHVGDVGHTLILGKTGGGKSTMLAFLMAQQFRYQGAQVFAFDKGYSSYVLCNASGGDYYDIGGEKSDLAFAPLSSIDTPADQAWAIEWIETLLALQGVNVGPGHRATITDAVQRLAGSSSRTLTELISQIQDTELRAALGYYQLGGALGHLLDAEQDGLRAGRFQVFEMEHLMDMGEKAVVPVLLYLFRQVEKRMDGRPTLVTIDEAWLALSHPAFREKIRDWLKTWRKKNAAVVLATQELADVMNSPIRDALLASCPTKVLLPNPEAMEPAQSAWYGQIGLNEREVQILAQATPKRHYYLKSPMGRRLFGFDFGPVALSFIGTSGQDDIRHAKHLMDQHGQRWPAEWLRQRGLGDWADYWERI